MNWHLQNRIADLLNWSDSDLKELFDRDPIALRMELEEKKAAGEVYIPSAGCKGFDPVTGCPGHPDTKQIEP